MTSRHIDEYFRSLGTWVNWEATTDIFTFGDADGAVRKIAVAWKPTYEALRLAAENKVDLFISHESIAVKAVNRSMRQDIEFMLPSEAWLFDFLGKADMTVYRCHDFLDAVPEWGVMDTWQRGLELGGRIVSREYPNIITEVPPMTVEELAKHILIKIAPLRQRSVQISGHPKKSIRRITTGTGCAHNIERSRELGSEVSIVVNDAYSAVRMGSHMRDSDYPMIVVDHSVSEEWAVRNLSDHLSDRFPDIEVMYIPQFCSFTSVCS